MSKRDDSSGLDGGSGRWCRHRRGAHHAHWAIWGAVLTVSEACREESARDPVTISARAADAKVSPFPLGIGPRRAPRVVWSADLGSVVFAQPTLAPGPQGAPTVFVGALSGRFVGVAAAGPRSGEVVLERWLDGMVWSTAATDGERLYVGSDDDRLSAIDAETGAIVWQRRLGTCEPVRARGPEGTRCDVDGGPLLAPDGDLYVGADGVYRITTSGQVRWHAAGEGAHVFSRPLWTPQGTVVFGGQDGTITAVAQDDGAVRWRHVVGADVDGSAAIDEDGTIYIGADDGRVYAIDDDGRLQWTFATGRDIRSGVVLDRGALSFGSFDGGLYRLDPTSGDLAWWMQAGGALAATPSVDREGWLFVGSRDRRLYAVSPEGVVGWSLAFPAEIDSAVTLGPDGTLYFGADDGHLRALRADG